MGKRAGSRETGGGWMPMGKRSFMALDDDGRGKRWRQTDGFWSPMGKRRRSDDGVEGEARGLIEWTPGDEAWDRVSKRSTGKWGRVMKKWSGEPKEKWTRVMRSQETGGKWSRVMRKRQAEAMRKRAAEAETKWSRVMRKRENEEAEGKWSRVMRKRQGNDDEDEEDEDKNEADHEEVEEEDEEHRGILQGEPNPEEDYVAESFFY